MSVYFCSIVSTDALARGIDIPDVDCVVSYDVPKQAKLYIHRTGRTGRAGRAGTALTLLLPQQLPQFEHMIRSAGKHTTVNNMPAPLTQMEALEEDYVTALSFIKQLIKVNYLKYHYIII
jgi:superfamily II DNA/RNA helicase